MFMRVRSLAGLAVLLVSCGGGTGDLANQPLDSGASESALSSSCAGLVPALPPRSAASFDFGPQNSCQRTLLQGDETGALIPWQTQYAGADNFDQPIVDALSGALIGDVAAIGPAPLSGKVGFIGQAMSFNVPADSIYATDRTGRGTGATSWRMPPASNPNSTYVPNLYIGIDYAGGASVLETGRPDSGSLFLVKLQLFDASAQPRGPAVQIASTHQLNNQQHDFITGVDLLGHVLTLYPGFFEGHGTGTLMARWFDRSGRALTPSFAMGGWVAASSTDEVELVPLIGGGFALQKNGLFHAVFPSARATVRAPPPWLQNVHGHLRLARGAKAYAAMPIQVGANCAEQVQIFAPAGNSCGSLDLSAGDHCSYARVDLARDGTLLQDRASCRTLWWWLRALE
jgi:hypothetical protein